MKQFLLILIVAIFLVAAGCTDAYNGNTSGNIAGSSSSDKTEVSETQPDLVWRVLPEHTSTADIYPPSVIAPTMSGDEVADLIVYAKNPENTVQLGESVSINVVFESVDETPGIIYAYPPGMFIGYPKSQSGFYQSLEYFDERGEDIIINPGEKLIENVVWTPDETGEFCLFVTDVNVFDGEIWEGHAFYGDSYKGVPVANITVKA